MRGIVGSALCVVATTLAVCASAGAVGGRSSGSDGFRTEPGSATHLFSSVGGGPRAAAPAVRAGHGHPHRLCVGHGAHCFATVQAAVDAAQDGDLIRIHPGTYAGGITIDKSIELVGANARVAVIRGGGPVITIGRFFGSTEPTVTISRLTVTGGSTSSSEQANLFWGIPGAWAIGGGVYIPPAAGFTPGATVTISDSVISGNRASPTATFAPTPPAPGWPRCPGGLCPFAGASGGGIANDGNLTLLRTTVSDNRAIGPVASDAIGGGIWLGFAGGSLTMRDSRVTGNSAIASDPNGRFAEGGGIFTSNGTTVTVDDSEISGNTARLTSSFPYFLGNGDTLELGVNSGGFHMSAGGSLVIRDTEIDGNAIVARVPNGEPEVFDSGLCTCGGGTLDLSDSSISNNSVTASFASNAGVFACCGFSAGGALEFDGPARVSSVTVTNNTTNVTSSSGAAIANGTVANFSSDSTPATLANSVISGNSVTATSASGRVRILGVGLLDAGLLELRRDQIADNVGTAHGARGSAQGGGIWAGRFPGGPPVELAAIDSTITHNRLQGSRGITLHGGGLYTQIPVTLLNTAITANSPDNCFGAMC